METLSREMLLGMLRTGSNGNQILEILDVIVPNADADVAETQEQQVAA